MSKLDSTKEILNTLRTGFGITIAVILTLTAGLINIHYKDNIDIIFFIGIFLDLIFISILPILIRYIVKYTKVIEEL